MKNNGKQYCKITNKNIRKKQKIPKENDANKANFYQTKYMLIYIYIY